MDREEAICRLFEAILRHRPELGVIESMKNAELAYDQIEDKRQVKDNPLDDWDRDCH